MKNSEGYGSSGDREWEGESKYVDGVEDRSMIKNSEKCVDRRNFKNKNRNSWAEAKERDGLGTEWIATKNG